MRGWNRDEALALIDTLAPSLKSVGYYIGLTGSVLIKGTSRNDLDLIVYPASTTAQDKARVAEVLTSAGLQLIAGKEAVHRKWHRSGSTDEKHVEYWELDARKIDVFFLA